jgi:hypothetical protein
MHSTRRRVERWWEELRKEAGAEQTKMRVLNGGVVASSAQNQSASGKRPTRDKLLDDVSQH